MPKYKLDDFETYLFIDEVDHTSVNWDRIRTNPNYKNVGMWLAMNAERFEDNKTLINRFSKEFQAIQLDYILRNTKLVTEFVNELRTSLTGVTGKLSKPRVGHCVDGIPPKILFLELFNKTANYSNIPELIGFCEKRGLSTIKTFQGLPHAIKVCICEMFNLSLKLSFVEMISEMQPVCIAAQDVINEFLVQCFKIMDEYETFRTKITFETSQGVIGREFPNVIYPAISYMYLINKETSDIIYSELMNVSSRSKNQLYLIDVGRKETQKVHQVECRSRFEKTDKVHQLSYQVFNERQRQNTNELRHKILPAIMQKGLILPRKVSCRNAVEYLGNSSKFKELTLEHPSLRRVDLDTIVESFNEYKKSQVLTLTGKSLPFLPILITSTFQAILIDPFDFVPDALNQCFPCNGQLLEIHQRQKV